MPKINMCRRVLPFLAVFCACLRLSTANSAMAIDLGSEFMKLTLIKPGVPMETVLNRESQRKTPTALAIKDGERFLGEAARRKAYNVARHAYTFFLDLAGKQMDDPIVAAFRAQFPYLVVKPHPKRGTVQFETDVGDISLECALGMLLWNARQEVEAYAGHLVRDTVIAVPSYFGQVERAAVEAAAKIADMNLLQLLGSGTAAALNYGVFRRKEITEQPQTLLIYDVGSTKTLVTIVQFRLVANDAKESAAASAAKTANNSYPQVETIGVGYDRALGGHHLTLRLRDHLASAFKQQNPSLGADITENPQAMAKLLKEADRVKQVLSANIEHFAHVESVFQDRDFRVKVTRDELEKMFSDFEQRHLEPITAALAMAQLSVEQLDRVALMGAGTRVPRLKTILGTFFQGKELGRMLNTDEAIALGAIYHAARLSKRFIVKPFEVKEMAPPASQPAEANIVDGEQQLLVNSTIMDEEEIKEAKRILNDFERNEKAKLDQAVALNQLESAVYDYSAKLEEDDFTCFGTEEELQLVREQVAKMKDWLDDMPNDTSVEELKQKRRDLMAPIRKLKNRKRQKEDRPALMDKLTATLDEAEKKLQAYTSNSASSKEFFTEGELTVCQRTIDTVKVWLDEVNKQLPQLKDNQDATFTTDDFKTKRNMLVAEMRALDAQYAAGMLRLKREAEAAARKVAEEAAAAAAAANTTTTEGMAEELKVEEEGGDQQQKEAAATDGDKKKEEEEELVVVEVVKEEAVLVEDKKEASSADEAVVVGVDSKKEEQNGGDKKEASSAADGDRQQTVPVEEANGIKSEL